MRIGRARVTVHLELPSRLESLDQAGEVVDRLSEVAGFDEDARLHIQLRSLTRLVADLPRTHAGSPTWLAVYCRKCRHLRVLRARHASCPR